MERRIVLCRHTQTDHNVQRIYGGQMNVPLNAVGLRQADRLAEQIAELDGICGVISSDLVRTRYLAHRIGRLSGISFRLLPELREVSIGRLEGMTRQQFPLKYQGKQFRTSNPQFDFTEVGGENAAMVIERYEVALRWAGRYFDAASPDLGEARIVVVGHGTALRLLFRDHFGLIDQLHDQGKYQEVPWPF